MPRQCFYIPGSVQHLLEQMDPCPVAWIVEQASASAHKIGDFELHKEMKKWAQRLRVAQEHRVLDGRA